MRKLSFILATCLIGTISNTAMAQKTVNAAVLEFDVVTKGESVDANSDAAVHQKYYYAPDQLRIDAWYGDGSAETYFNGKTNIITSFASGGGESIYYAYAPATWKKKSPIAVLKFEPLSEEKTIQGHKCKAAKIYHLQNEWEKVFYTIDLIPQTEKNATTKQGIPGFVLERESYNKNNELVQTTKLKSFEQKLSPAKTFIPDTKGYTKQELY